MLEEVKCWVRENKSKGVDGIKFFGVLLEIMMVVLEENKCLGLGFVCYYV